MGHRSANSPQQPGSPAPIGKLPFVVSKQFWIGATTLLKHAVNHRSKVVAPHAFHHRQALCVAQAGGTKQYKPGHLCRVTHGVFDGYYSTNADGRDDVV